MGDEQRTDLSNAATNPPRVAREESSASPSREVDPLGDLTGVLHRLSSRRHEVREELGRGGMGAVHRLRDLALQRDVAMKSARAPQASDDARSLLDEAQISGRLDHPHIVPVHDVGLTADGTAFYFTMKLVKGETFSQFAGGLHGEPDWNDHEVERCLQVIVRVCDALAFSHSRGVVHCDVKPTNVMVGSFGQVYLMDWGLAMLVARGVGDDAAAGGTRVPASPAAEHTSRSRRAGTPEYMAPEQVRGETSEIDGRTDVYGVGGLLYYLLTAQGPNAGSRGSPRSEVPKPVPSPSECGAWAKLPPELVRIAMKALAFERDERYATVMALKSDLEEFLRGGGWFETRRYGAGSVIVNQGDDAKEAYMIVSGNCEVTQSVDGKTHRLRKMGPGDVFGETAILTDGFRTATVIAATNVIVKVVGRDAFDQELSRPSWLGAFVRAIAERFRDVDAQLAQTRK